MSSNVWIRINHSQQYSHSFSTLLSEGETEIPRPQPGYSVEYSQLEHWEVKIEKDNCNNGSWSN